MSSVAVAAGRNSNSNSNNSDNTRRSLASSLPVLLRLLLLDLPLFLLFAVFLLVFFIRLVHDDYYRQLFDRAERTDAQLLQEFTYYQRECSALDWSTRDLGDLVVQPDATAEAHMQQFLTHGAMVFPEVLSPADALALRQYIQQRNAQVTDAEAYPVSQGTNRISYGIEPTEHPAVARAVQKITTHRVFRSVITNLLGDADPASAEITAITGYYGCPHQVWHADTKAHGNALLYARTYTHSYSLFVPLQNTTEQMGITGIAPGTHYCANDIGGLCEQYGMGLQEALPDKIFPAGSAALINQHMWHRGTAHTDPNAPERIVFILSFLSRPKPQDPRMLARGTYFHQKWLMWGMTYRDLMDPYRTMTRPWSILKCLCIWKPWHRNWGWDLVTSGYLRFSNGQLEDQDFYDRFLPNLDQWHFPEWLRGDVWWEVPQKVAWTRFIQGTIDKTYGFVKTTTKQVHAIYGAGIVIVAAILLVGKRDGLNYLKRTTRRVLVGHGLLAVLAYLAIFRIKQSEWGQSVKNGSLWRRPFPAVEIPRDDVSAMVSQGLTTLPTRNDVLIGSRFDAKFLGSYDQWLDFHPGNALFRSTVASVAQWYTSLELWNSTLDMKERLVRHVRDVIVNGSDGRFLQQDHRNGDWRLMSEFETNETIQSALLIESYPVTARVVKELDYIMANYRFGSLRETALARRSQLHVWYLRRTLLGLSKNPDQAKKMPKAINSTTTVLSFLPVRLVPKGDDPLLSTKRSPAHERFTLHTQSQSDIRAGSLVWVYYLDKQQQKLWYPCTIMRMDDDGTAVVSYEDGTEERVARERIQKRTPVVEGDSIVGCYRPYLQDCYDGTVIRVMPNQDVAVAFESGHLVWRVPNTNYYQHPFVYVASD